MEWVKKKGGRTPAACAGEEGWRRGGSRRTVRRQSAALSAHGRRFPVQESAVREQDDRADLQIRSWWQREEHQQESARDKRREQVMVTQKQWGRSLNKPSCHVLSLFSECATRKLDSVPACRDTSLLQHNRNKLNSDPLRQLGRPSRLQTSSYSNFGSKQGLGDTDQKSHLVNLHNTLWIYSVFYKVGFMFSCTSKWHLYSKSQ